MFDPASRAIRHASGRRGHLLRRRGGAADLLPERLAHQHLQRIGASCQIEGPLLVGRQGSSVQNFLDQWHDHIAIDRRGRARRLAHLPPLSRGRDPLLGNRLPVDVPRPAGRRPGGGRPRREALDRAEGALVADLPEDRVALGAEPLDRRAERLLLRLLQHVGHHLLNRRRPQCFVAEQRRHGRAAIRRPRGFPIHAGARIDPGRRARCEIECRPKPVHRQPFLMLRARVRLAQPPCRQRAETEPRDTLANARHRRRRAGVSHQFGHHRRRSRIHGARREKRLRRRAARQIDSPKSRHGATSSVEWSQGVNVGRGGPGDGRPLPALSANITETPGPLGITVGRWR